MNVADIALMAELTADTGSGGVATLATGGVHQLDAGASNPPYVVFQEASDFPSYAAGNVNKADRVFYMIRAFAVDANEGGVTTVAKIADRLKVLLTNPSLAVSGKDVLSCRFDRAYPPQKEHDKINQRFIYSRGVLVEMWLADASNLLLLGGGNLLLLNGGELLING